MGSGSAKELGNRAAAGTPKFYEHVPTHAYREAAERKTGGFDGASGHFIGADELDSSSVREYVNSANSHAKTQIIEDLIATGTNLGLKIAGNTPQEKIKSMSDLLNTSRQIAATDETHQKLCRAIALAINKAHGNEIIDVKLAPAIVCQQVAEIISSLSAGMHTEFLMVYSDVKKVLQNLHVLKDALKDDHTAIKLRITQSDDQLLPQQLVALDDLHVMLTNEIERQISMLSNLLNVTLTPTEKALSELIKNKKNLHGYIEKINVKVGSENFSKVIADILKGLGITANFALLIERALKTVGMTIDEYAKGESIQKLREKITQGVMGKNLTDEQLHEYLEAAELLYRNFYRNQDIANFSKAGSDEMFVTGISGGDEMYPKSHMDKRIADRKKVRDLIFNTFYRQINALFDQLVGSIDSLSMKIGTEIPLSEQLSSFRHILQRIDEGLVRNKNIYYALIGYYNDAMSKSKRDAFVGDLNMISSYIETLLEMPLYSAAKQHFVAVQGYIKAITGLIDRYSDEIAAKFGRGEESDPECMHLEKKEGATSGAFEFADAVYGGNELYEDPKILYRTTKSIHDAIRQFDYKYRVAQIRANMAATGKELKHYSEKYEKIIANSIADILNDDKKIYEKLRKQLTDKAFFGEDAQYRMDNVIGFDTDAAVSAEREAAIKMLDYQWEVKKKFWSTVEAVDTYMKVFTDALVNNPNDIQDIKSMISSIEVIGDWYSEKTGNDLAGIFDHFPSMMGDQSLTTDKTTAVGTRQVVYPPTQYRDVGSGSHYYQQLQRQLNVDMADDVAAYRSPSDVAAAALPGNPYLVTIPSYGEHARNQAKKTLNGLAVLKNLLSVFVNIGAKFNGEELRKKVFMTPSQMYNNITDYLSASAFAQGFGIGDLRAAEDLPNEFFTAKDMSVEIDMKNGQCIQSSPIAVDGWSSTYVPGSTQVHLGVTAQANVSTVDHHYTKSAIADRLVDKINNASESVLNVLAEGDRYEHMEKQTWKSTAKTQDRILLFKKRWGVWMRSVISGLREKEGFSFAREDEYFVLIMKSLAAKILTVVGMYDVLDRPMEFNGLSAIRMITGGSAETPKVDAEAVALYLRLPLLAEFYRGIFGFEGPQDPNNEWKKYDTENWRTDAKNNMLKISMVPDIDGAFAGLIRLIFRKNKFLSGTSYADEDLKELIREINLVYQRMKSKYPQNTVMETINEFVAEINRRYGVVSENERNKYEQEFGHRYDYSVLDNDRLHPIDRYDVAPETDIAILPGEGEEEIERKSAAQRLLGETFDTPAEKKRLFTISKQHKDLVYRFRCAIDKYFEDPDEEFTFDHAIKSTQLKLKGEQNDDARFKIVAALVRGVDVYSKVDGMKYVLFHETVVGGLNLLSAMHSMLARFKRRVHCIDLRTIENQIWEYFSIDGEKSIGDMIEYITKFLTSRLGVADDGDMKIMELIANTLGFSEAFVENGGHSNIPFMLKLGAGISESVERIPKDFSVKSSATADDYDKFIDKTAGRHVFTCNKNTMRANPKKNIADAHVGGLASVLAGFSVEQLREAYKMPEPVPSKYLAARNAADTFMRFIFGREYIMKELLETVFGISSDFQGLVDVKIEDGKLFMSWGGLKTMIEDMFQHIGYFIDLLRPHIKSETMMRYTNKFTPGSFYWLQEQIMEKIITGRPPQLNAAPGEEARVGYASIDELMQNLTYTYQQLTRRWTIDGAKLEANGAESKVNQVGQNRNSFDKVFAEMIFYDASKPSSGIAVSDEAPNVGRLHDAIGGLKIVDYMHDPYESLHFSGPAGAKQLDTRYASRFYQLYSWKDEFTMNRSAMFAFNQLMAKYIKSFYDPVAGKIYAGTLNQFANGAFSRSISDQMFTYPDTAPLWFVKYAGGGDVKLPNTYQLTNGMDNAERDLVRSTTMLLSQYLNIGVAPGDSNVPANRAGLLKMTHPALRGTMSLARAGGSVDVPAMYIYLMLHAIGAIINELFEMHARGTAIDASGIALAHLGNGGADMDSIATGVYGTTSPKITHIMNVLLVNPNSLVAIVGNADGAGATELAMPAAGSMLAGVIGDFTAGAPVIYKNMKSLAYKDVFNSLLRFPDAYNGAFGRILNTASQLFLQSDDAYRTPSEIEYRAELYAGILVRLKKSVTSATQQAADKLKKEIVAELTTVKSTYSGPLTGQPKHIVKQDDLFAVNDKYWNAADIYAPTGDANYLVLARKEPVASALEADNITRIPGNVGQNTNVGSNTIAEIQNFGQRCDPDGDHILFTSLSVILKNLMQTRSTQNQSLVYILDNVADIPLYMKEKMRASLPSFRNLFKELATRCEFIKKAIGQSNVSCEREFLSIPTHNPWPYVLNAPQKDSAAAKSRFIGILDSVVRGCTTMITSCEQVLREIGDDPKYFEMYQNSIKDYKTQYGVDPLMPLTSSLCVLKNTTTENEMTLFPGHALGQEQFKLNYGLRSMLNQPTAQPLPEHIIGFTSIVDGFNLITDSKLQADKARAENFMKTFVKMLRYVNELKNIKGILTPYVLTPSPAAPFVNGSARSELLINGLFTRDDLIVSREKWGARKQDASPVHSIHGTKVGPTIFKDGPLILTNRADISIVDDGRNNTRLNGLHEIKQKYSKPVFALAKSLTDTIRMTESSFKEEKIKELVEYLCKEGKGKHSLAVQNIIDLGIVPINIHALMREIPLVNLYNYAYTFDRLVIELYYGLQNDNARKLISELCSNAPGLKNITSAKDMLVALLINPYMNVFDDDNADHISVYDKHTKSMLAGAANNGELGRPKFLSDQVYNKAVFGQLYASREEYSEVGPIAKVGQITEDIGCAAIGALTANIIQDLNGKQRFANITVAANSNNVDLINLCKAVAKYVAANPTVSGDKLVELIVNKFLSGRYAEFTRLQLSQQGKHARHLAIFIAFITKLVYLPMALLVSRVNEGKSTPEHFRTTESLLKACLYALNSVGLNDIDAADPDKGRYMGLDKGNNANAHNSPDSNDEAVKILTAMAASALTLTDDKIERLSAGKYDSTILKAIMARSVISFPLAEKRVYKKPRDISDAALNIHTLHGLIGAVNKHSTEAFSAHELHWISAIDANGPEYGVGVQKLPRGDNDNVVDAEQVQSVDVGAINSILADIGRLRFDTVFIRNLIFIVNLYRSIRMKLQRDLVYSRDIILKAEPVTRMQLTEFHGNQVDAGVQRANYVNYQKSPLWARYNY